MLKNAIDAINADSSN